MMFRYYRHPSRIAVGLLVFVLVFGGLLTFRTVNALQRDPVTAAWQQARAAGSYHFTANVVQVTTPAASIYTIGRSSDEQRLYLEGQTDLRAESLQMHVWTGSGNVTQPETALQIRYEDGTTSTRQGAGAWQEISSVTDAMAPGGDFLAYLSAIRNMQAGEPETRAGLKLTRYSFDIDGPTFGEYMRRELERHLTAQGELPPGLQIGTPDFYRDLRGTGEVWIAETGLPVRQVLHLTFPEQQEQQVSAHITVNFSQFGIGPHTLQAWLTDHMPPLEALVALLLVLGFAWALVTLRRSRMFGTVLALLLIGILVLQPFLSSLQSVQFFETQMAHAAEQEAAYVDQQAIREIQAAQINTDFDPHHNPLAGLEAAPPPATGQLAAATDLLPQEQAPLQQVVTVNADRDGDGLSDADEVDIYITDPNDIDTDNDTLSDYIEVRIGTNPLVADTDGDTLSDAVEVAGFTYNNQTWYLDPLEIDSNNDGLGDGQEWFQTNALLNERSIDSDGNGIPDAFDLDNDGDGVPDAMDSAPYTHTGPFSDDNPLGLILEDLRQDTPTFVDFQIRPTDPKHLWYAQNVLDWPEDREGQVQDDDGATFADVALSEGRAPVANESFGDMKLVPMLEIRIDGSTTHLPSEDELAEYGISISNLEEDEAGNLSGKVVYVPLNVQTNEKTGERVAFTARMLYNPESSVWGNAHDVRLTWLIQVLTDDCEQVDNNQCVEYRRYNQTRIAHSYYADWHLTGLTIAEERGTNVAAIYEDPAVDTNLREDDALWLLAAGLDGAFLIPRTGPDRWEIDTSNPLHPTMRLITGDREVTVDELARRFNHPTNSAVTEEERWGIPNILRVNTPAAPYATFDKAIMDIGTDKATDILNTAFAGSWQQDNSLKPLITYVIETERRTVTLDALMEPESALSPPYVSLTNNTLTMDMNPAFRSPISVDTLGTVKWTAYCADQATEGTPNWNPCATEAYLDELEARYSIDDSRLPGDDDTTAEGRQFAIQLFYLILSQARPKPSKLMAWCPILTPTTAPVLSCRAPASPTANSLVLQLPPSV
ncbi:MAG: hypothetical protein HC914_13610 [Chloroflexaceae bacterium]|nr:hypothetical protein [Chloroflexaceae bacterium]